MYIMVEMKKSKSELRTKIRRMREELEDLEEELARCDDNDREYNSRGSRYNDDERYRDRDYDSRERGRYGRY